jgi:hypothetical protein
MRWGYQPKQIIEAAIDGQIKLYFSLGYGVIADLPNPNPGRSLQLRPYQGSLQVDQTTLNALLHTNEAPDVKEAYTPEGTLVYVERPAQEFSPQVGGNTTQMHVQITPPLNIKTADLHAFMEDVEAHEEMPAPAQTVTSVPLKPASDGPEKSSRTKRLTWRDESEAYLERTFKELQCPTVKVFFRALMSKAGADSPYDKGVGHTFGSLFARKPGVKVTEKMIEGFVTDLRKKM